MANSAAKKTTAENERFFALITKILAGVNAFYIAYRIVYHFKSLSITVGLVYLATTAISLFLYAQLASIKASGEDLHQEGLTAYFLDIIYVTWACTVLSALLTDKAWWLYAVIPAYAGFKAWGWVLSPLLNRSKSTEDADPNAGKSKRQIKMEKRSGGQTRTRR